MIRQLPFVAEKIWGCEKWCVSAHGAGESRDEGGRALSLITGDYPLLVKIIRADAPLSVQVHPDDVRAAGLGYARGKTECWYVLEAAAGAEIICGLSPARAGARFPGPGLKSVFAGGSREEIEAALNFFPACKGDLIYIPAGLIHGLTGGVRLLEVQQSSDVTYRVFDWGRGRALHLDKAMDAIMPVKPEFIRAFSGVFNSPYFSLELCGSRETPELSFVKGDVLFVAEGSGEIASGEGCFRTEEEDAWFFNGDERVALSGNLKIMKISLPAGRPEVSSGGCI